MGSHTILPAAQPNVFEHFLSTSPCQKKKVRETVEGRDEDKKEGGMGVWGGGL